MSKAEGGALEQLLDLFETKGVITHEEVRKIRETMKKEQDQLLEKEKAIKDKEKALRAWEEELKDKERALVEKETRPTTIEKDSPARVVGFEETLEGLGLDAVLGDKACLRSPDEDRFSLCLGGMLQADYRFFDYDSEDPEKNKFDIRRARLLIAGHALRLFNYKFEYEFEGPGSRRLLDAYVDASVFPFLYLRIGQFKEPFSLEQCTMEKNLFFAERSMGYHLTPGRDVGLMAHSSICDDRINYALGIFNGDGWDDATGGDEDAPECTGRIVLSPLKNRGLGLWDNLQLGGSFGYSRIDSNNVDIHVETTGMTPFFDVSSRAKFNIIRNADDRTRYAAEFGWAYGPVALTSEYEYLRFRDIDTSSARFDSDFEAYYFSLIWMLTGERPVFSKGVLQPIKPIMGVMRGGLGGLGLGVRYDVFDADHAAYDNLVEEGVSVREAEAISIALNWYLGPSVRLILDATRTDFDRPLLIDRDSITGEAIYEDREDVLTARFQFGF
ncbi:MAG: porin [Thermodesulfobacteriota bacterium]|nr:porin [Thermodesulfobacteriota bacterium]